MISILMIVLMSQGPQAPPTVPAPPQAPPVESIPSPKADKTSLIVLIVPAKSLVYADGELTNSTGSTREFAVPALPNRQYAYKFKVVSSGKAKEVTVLFRPGDEVREEVSFSASPFEPKTASPDGLDVSGSLPPWPDLLEGMEEYTRTKSTQRIYNQGEETDRVSRFVTDQKWHQSGGMLGITGYKSRVYKFTPAPVRTFASRIWVKHSFATERNPSGQYEVGLNRSYPNGTRFIDRLTNSESGKDFEVRMLAKSNNKWRAKVVFSDESERPAGYVGLKQTCSSCHDEAGTGIYGDGLVPGGDFVISDEFDWSILRTLSQQDRRMIRQQGE